MSDSQSQSSTGGHRLGGPELSNIQLLSRMLELTWKFRWGCVRAFVVQFILLTISLGGLGLSGLGLDVIHHAISASVRAPRWPLGLKPPEEWPALALVFVAALSVVVLALFRTGVSYANAIMQQRFVLDIVVHLRSKVYDKLQRLSFRFYDANESGSIINRVTGDVQGVRMFVDGVIIQGVNLLLSLSICLVYMLSIHRNLTLVCLATTPLLWAATIIFSKLVRPAYKTNRELFDKAILVLKENVEGVHVVKGFGLQNNERQKFATANDAVQVQQRWIFRCIGYYMPFITFLTQINLAILLVYGGYLVLENGKDPSQGIALGAGLWVFFGLLQQFSGQVNHIANVTNSVQQSLIAAGRVFEVLDAPLEIKSPPHPVGIEKLHGDVKFENVTFGYRREDPVLQGVSFEVKAGQCIAVLGSTGAGKSTLLSLIPRFYDPDSGRVLIDGVDVREFDVDDLRRGIGLVFQESFLFSNTVAANIAFGHPEASREQIERAAKIAAAHEFITELPKGYDTLLGERASNLSGGQRQRLAIARALLLDPSILILDDATAAVDPETEHEILQAMDQAMKGRTTFVVAHRLSTLRRANHVIVIENGKIVERGTHEQLMNSAGHYRRAARLQLADEDSLKLLGMTAAAGEAGGAS